MTIDIPALDDKSYTELFEAAEKRLPAYDDGWTDYNPSDPGIVLLELFAFLTDTYTYQLDSITDDHRRKYLRLMGETQRPPEPANIRLSLGLPEGVGSAQIPAGTQLGVIVESDTELVFETTHDMAVQDVAIASVVSDHGAGRTDQTFANQQPGMFYRAFGPNPAPGNAMAIGLEGDPFEDSDRFALSIDFHEDDLPPVATHGEEDPDFVPSVDLVWEYCTDYEDAQREHAWESLPVAHDGTDAFYRGGRLTLERPADWAPTDWGAHDHGINDRAPGLIWLRCRVVTGGYEIPPQFDSVQVNVVRASHRRTIDHERLRSIHQEGDLSKLTAQAYAFAHAPVLEATILVDGDPWTEVADLDNSAPTEPHYVLDRATGTVRFGDGITGRMPPPTATVVAEPYVHGGGREGNVPAASNLYFLDREAVLGDDLRLGDVSVRAVSAGTGGADPESLTAAFRRTRRDLRTPTRTVTEEDYRYVATHTPGLRFGRATVLLEEGPELGGDDDPVRVVVVVVPYAPLGHPRPMPSEGFLAAVQRHIDHHRLVGDRVAVEAPDYADLTVEAAVQTAGWIPEARVREAIESSINEYIHAIHGFDGEGWPFGRTLYKADVRDRLAGIDIIDHVRDLSIQVHGNARVDGDENVLIDDATLLALADVRTDIRAGTTAGNGE